MGEVRFLPRIGFSEPDPANEFVAVAVGLANVSKNRRSFNQYGFALQTRAASSEDAPIILGLDSGLGVGELAPDGQVSGWAPFEIRLG